MKISGIFITAVLFILSQTGFSQEKSDVGSRFGKPYIKVFANFNGDYSSSDPQYAFDLTRAYVGHKADLGTGFESNVCIDFGSYQNGSKKELKGYFKYAALFYKKEKFSAVFGLIGLNHFHKQEKMWGHRYVYKSFLDENKWSHSSDFGVSLQYDFTEWLSFDGTLRNGEGYKSLQTDNTLRGGVGTSLELKSGFVGRLYYDLYQKSVAQSTYSGFVGYKFKKLATIGAEYNYMQNANWKEGYNISGMSFFASYNLTDKFEVFGRYDKLASVYIESIDSEWNAAKDGQTFIGGFQYKPSGNVKIALNHQGWLGSARGSDYHPMVFINLEYRFN